MFPITRLATTATKLERRSIKVLTKAMMPYGTEGQKTIEEIFATAKTDINKTLKPYSKNPFKRIVIWIQVFCENYKLKIHHMLQQQSLQNKKYFHIQLA